MPLFNRKGSALRSPFELRRAFEDACGSIATTRRKHQEAVGKASDAEIYRLANQLSKDLAPTYLYIDGILDEYLESQHGGRHAARAQ